MSNPYLDKFISLKNHPKERMRYILSVTENVPIPENYKSLEKHQHLVEIGEEALNIGDLTRALQMYTESLRYAPHTRNSEVNVYTGEGFANRAKVLHEMKEYIGAERDLDRAFFHDPKNRNNNELLLRKEGYKEGKCQPKSKTENLSLSRVNNNSNNSNCETTCTSSHVQNDLLRPVPEFSSCMKVSETPTKGRHVLATTDIDTGNNGLSHSIIYYTHFLSKVMAFLDPKKQYMNLKCFFLLKSTMG